MSTPAAIAITGTSRGLGRAFAEHYLGRGWTVDGCGRSESDLDHADYCHTTLDIADEAAVRRWFSAIRKRRANGLYALINNAGVARMNHAMLTPGATVRQILDTNVVGTFNCCREAAKLMQRAGGRIVNLSTVAVPLALEGEAAYAASKAAVENLTRVLAREFAPLGITVNAVGPTPVRTDLIAGVPDDTLQALLARQPLPRYAEPGDVLNVLDFFLSPASDFVTGQVLYLGGV